MTTRAFYAWLWVVLAAMAVIDAVAAAPAGIRIAGLGRALLPLAFMLALALALGRSPDARLRRLAAICHVVAISAAMSYAAIGLTYAAAAAGRPAIDAWLLAADRALGFDWPAYRQFIVARPWLASALALAYASMTWQAGAAAAFLASRGDRNLRVMLAALLAGLVATIAVFWLAPAYNAEVGLGLIGAGQDSGMAAIAGLRAGAGAALDLVRPPGLVSFPSYHTIVGVVLIWTNWHGPWRRAITLPLNLLLIAATPVFGAHYLVDTIAGALLALALLFVLERRIP